MILPTVSCSADTAPTDGSRTAANADYLNTVTYECNTGYTGGSVLATCQAGGTFDLSAPTCTIGLTFFAQYVIYFILYHIHTYSILFG